MPMPTKCNNVCIEDEPQNITGMALPADTVDGCDQFSECHWLLLAFGFHAITISVEACKYYGVFAL